MSENEIVLQLDYLGVVKDTETQHRVASFICSSFISKKDASRILKSLQDSERYGDPSFDKAKLLRQEALNGLVTALK